jgi:hypothetical protein
MIHTPSTENRGRTTALAVKFATVPAGGAIAACGLAPAAHADEYGLTPDYGCPVKWHGSGPATMSKPSCIDAFLDEAHKDNLVSHPTGGQSSDTQLLSDALIACYHGPASCKGSAPAVTLHG